MDTNYEYSWERVTGKINLIKDKLKEIKTRQGNLSDKEKFIMKLYYLDWYYGYSDCRTTWNSGKKNIDVHKELSKEHGLEFVFGLSNEDRHNFFSEQQCVIDMLQEDKLKRDEFYVMYLKGFTANEIAHWKCGEYQEEMAQFMNSLPETYGNEFIHTCKTALHPFRVWALETGNVGLTISDTSQQMTNSFFASICVINPNRIDLLIKICDKGMGVFRVNEQNYNLVFTRKGEEFIHGRPGTGITPITPFNILTISTIGKRYNFIVG